MNGRAPNRSLTGSQSPPAKNLKPKACQEGPDPLTSSKTIRKRTAKTAKPQAVIADWKTRSAPSPPELRSNGIPCTASDVTFVVATGCGPGISGRENAGLAIDPTLADGCYKGVKIGVAFSVPRHVPADWFDLRRMGRILQLLIQVCRFLPSVANPSSGRRRKNSSGSCR